MARSAYFPTGLQHSERGSVRLPLANMSQETPLRPDVFQFLRVTERHEVSDAVATASWGEKKRIWIPVLGENKAIVDYVPGYILEERGTDVDVMLEESNTVRASLCSG